MDTRSAVCLAVLSLYFVYADSTVDTNSTTSVINSAKETERYELPPPVFPDDSTKYKIVPGDESLIRILSEEGDKRARASEIYDLLHSSQYVEPSPLSPFKGTSLNATSGQYVNLKLQSELLQEDRDFVARDDPVRHHLAEHAGHGHSIGGKIGYLTGTLAATVVGALVFIVLASYLGILLWKRKQQSKYANRQALQFDDDSTLEDDRNFEII